MANNCPPTDVHYRLIELILFIVICFKLDLINCTFNKCDGKLLTEEICLPKTYQKSTLPSKPMQVNASLVIPNKNGIRKVDDDEMTITIDLHIMLYWIDNRILTNFTEDQKNEGRIPFGVSQVKHIWTPDLYVYNTSNFKILAALNPLAGLAVLTNFYWDEYGKGPTLNGTYIEYYVESEVTIYCNFQLHLYPMDEQECELKIGSSNYGRGIEFQLVESIWKGIYGPGFYHSKDFYVETYFQESKNDYLGSDYFSNMKEIGFKIKLKRCILSYVFKYYISCAAIVIISQISFLIPPDQVPGRIALLVTTFLILVNIFIGQQAESPSSNQLSALSIYLLTCLFFVGCAILEFAYLLQRRRSAEQRSDCKRVKQFPTKKETFETLEEEMLNNETNNKEEEKLELNIFERRQFQLNEWNGRKIEKQKFWSKSHIIDCKCCRLNVDILSQWIFFLMFMLFNACYWIHYLKLYPNIGILY